MADVEAIYYILGIIIAVTEKFPECITEFSKSINFIGQIINNFLVVQDKQIIDYQAYITKLCSILSPPPLSDKMEFGGCYADCRSILKSNS